MTSQNPHRPKVAIETVRPFRELFDALEQTGFDTEHRAPVEQRSADAVDALAIYLLEKLADSEIELAIAAVRAWVALWFRPFLRRRDPPPTGISIPIYGPHGEVLSRVEVEADED